MPRISSPRPLDLTKPFVTSSQEYGSYPFDFSSGLVTYYRDVQGEFVPDLSGKGNVSRRGIAGRGITTSDDVPEAGVSFFGIKSFDLTFNAASSSDVDCFATVDGNGEISYSVDHKFTDGSNDLPFSISFWVRPSNVASTQYLITRAETSTNRSWEILIDAGVLRVTLLGSIARFIQSETSIAVMTSGTWQHVVITYDGSESAGGIKIYRNGLLQAMTTSSSVFPSAYLGMVDVDYPTVIGSRRTSGGFSADDYRGLIYGIAIWKNRVLSSNEISVLRLAYLNSSGGQELSGFISRSPRLHLRELDDLPGSYSTIRRTGDPTRTGTLISNFDDETSIVFSDSGRPSFPSMLPRGSSFNAQAVDIIGQESDIDVTLPIRSFQHPTYLHYSPTEDIGPFDENRAMPASSFYLIGTDPDVLPNFTSPIRSKVAIEIDITNQETVTLTRNVASRNTSESQPVSPDNTGFYYYNFTRRAWEQIGLSDPATGTSIEYDFAISTVAVETSGTFPSQFSFGNSESYTRTVLNSLDDPREAFGYSKIGSPTLIMGAPASTKYHATSSQVTRMSNFISDPFMLEAVRVELGTVTAQRTNGGSVPIPATPLATSTFASGSIRDIDNYVFFMYRQNHANRIIDSVHDVSSSKRYLICSASMAFWNSASLGGLSLLHGPTFSYEFGMLRNSTYNVGQFTGSISMDIRPAVAGPQYLGASSVPEIDGTSTNLIQNVWGGGTTISGSIIVGNGTNMIRPYDRDAGETLRDVVDRALAIDPRSLRKFGGEVQSQEEEVIAGFGVVSTGTPQSNPSPYILMPEDELVFGLEAGIPALFYSSLVSNLTGSHLQIEPSQCKVTLYGSLIKNTSEFLPSLNQDLSSNSIHEMIGNEPVLDQFMIEPRSSYYGSYLDDIVSGSMANPGLGGIVFSIPDDSNTRRVVGRRIS